MRGDQALRAATLAALLAPAAGCGGQTRGYDVVIDQERLCRAFDPAPESCALTNGPAVQLTLHVEDRDHGRAVLYARSDSTGGRVYLATRPRAGRYEVVEEKQDDNRATGCRASTRVVVALDVDERGLAGGEESRTEETGACNASGQRRITRRLREWRGSRVAGEPTTGVPSLP
jgi:hypothetical protein